MCFHEKMGIVWVYCKQKAQHHHSYAIFLLTFAIWWGRKNKTKQKKQSWRMYLCEKVWQGLFQPDFSAWMYWQLIRYWNKSILPYPLFELIEYKWTTVLKCRLHVEWNWGGHDYFNQIFQLWYHILMVNIERNQYYALRFFTP